MSIYTEDFKGKEYICKISKDFENESFYSEKEFTVIVKENDEFDSGLVAIISGINDDNEAFTEERDGEQVMKFIIFGNWETISKRRL